MSKEKWERKVGKRLDIKNISRSKGEKKLPFPNEWKKYGNF